MTAAEALMADARINLAIVQQHYVNEMAASPHGVIYLNELHKLAKDAVDWGFKNHLAHGTPCAACSPHRVIFRPPPIGGQRYIGERAWCAKDGCHWQWDGIGRADLVQAAHEKLNDLS